MLDYKTSPETKTIELIVGGKITEEEYDKVINSFEATTSDWDHFKLIELITDLKGMELTVLWKDIKFGLKKFSSINKKLTKCAIVADAKWIEIMMKGFQPFLKAEMRFFKMEDEDKAREWIKTD